MKTTMQLKYKLNCNIQDKKAHTHNLSVKAAHYRGNVTILWFNWRFKWYETFPYPQKKWIDNRLTDYNRVDTHTVNWKNFFITIVCVCMFDTGTAGHLAPVSHWVSLPQPWSSQGTEAPSGVCRRNHPAEQERHPPQHGDRRQLDQQGGQRVSCSFYALLSCVQIWIYIHWASKETYHFFRATLTKIHAIKINNIWTQISFNTP